MLVNSFGIVFRVDSYAQSAEKQGILQDGFTQTQKTEIEKAQKETNLVLYKELNLNSIEKKFVDKYSDKIDSYIQLLLNDNYTSINNQDGRQTLNSTLIYKNLKSLSNTTGLSAQQVLTLKDIVLKVIARNNQKLSPSFTLKKQVEIESQKNIKYQELAKRYGVQEKTIVEAIRNNKVDIAFSEKIFRDKMDETYKNVVERYYDLKDNNNKLQLNPSAKSETTSDSIEYKELEMHLLDKDKVQYNKDIQQKSSLELERGMYEVSTSKCDNNIYVQLPTMFTPGDILITNESKAINANTFTGHAGLIVNMKQVAEATGTDGKSRLLPIRDWCYKRELTTVGYVVRADKYRAAQAGSSWLLNRPYPSRYQMLTKGIWDISTLYCSQLVWRAYADQGRDIGSFWGYVAPGDIFYDNDTVFIYAWKKY